MRKALIGLLLAATAATPLAAQAADSSPRQQRAMEHYKRLEQRNQARYGNQHQERSERAAPAVRQQRAARAERRADRAERRANRSERQSNRAEQRAERLADRAERREQRTERRQFQPRWDAATPHYQRLKRENQRRYGNDRDWRDRDGDRDRWDRNRDRDRDGRWDGRRGRHDWNRDWRRDRRYDWQRWRWSNRNLFHIGPYYSPYRGYGYSRFSIGVFLDPGFYANRYWIGDPWQYRLPPAEPGTQWVRYYNDVLLVDIYTGEVLDVIYDFFW